MDIKKEIERFKNDKNGLIAICIIVGIILLVIGVIVMLFMIGQIKDFIAGGGCLLLVIPLAIIVVVAILAKKYLFEGKFPGGR